MKFLIAVLLLVGCAPRSDHKSIAELYVDHKAKLQDVVSKATPETKPIIENLLKLSDKNYEAVVPAELVQISEELDKLGSTAGYTSRPAIYQLSSNFRNIAKVENINPAAVKLALSRMLSLLTVELGTTKFNVK